MRKLNYPAGNATIKQQQKDIKLQYMKGSNIHLDNYQAITKSNLSDHKKAVHE